MPHVIVKMWPGKSEGQKKRLAERITQDVMDILDYGEESVSVAMEEIPSKDWAEKDQGRRRRVRRIRAHQRLVSPASLALRARHHRRQLHPLQETGAGRRRERPGRRLRGGCRRADALRLDRPVRQTRLGHEHGEVRSTAARPRRRSPDREGRPGVSPPSCAGWAFPTSSPERTGSIAGSPSRN
ncbi:tautomerase family protein [Rhodanobacter lindaniclasticus]